MANMTTYARPYVHAAFEVADEHDELPAWSALLQTLAQFAKEPEMIALLNSPVPTSDSLAELMIGLAGDGIDAHGQNFIRLLALNKRLTLLPDIAVLFERYKAAAEKIIDVYVVSAEPLSDAYLEKIKGLLEKRFKYGVSLHCEIDKNLIAGATIRAGDQVIDGSVRGQLQRLGQALSHEGL